MAKKGRYVYEWPRPMVTVDAVVFRFVTGKVQLLLIQRGNEPYKGKWALPGGFIDINEEIEVAVVRELAEETGLKGVVLEQMHTFGRCGRDPRGRQISVAFFGIASANTKKIKGGDDAAKAKWFDIGRLPEGMAFDHDEITKLGIKKLKRKNVYRLRKKV
jgi:8-oxo-dGTP diphosphatase